MATSKFLENNNQKYQSADIRMYPSAERRDSVDRNAKLFTERNITSIVNRLTSVPCFVIEGITISQGSSSSNVIIGKGRVNIFGYFFDIQKDIELAASALSSYKYLYLSSYVQGSDSYDKPFKLVREAGDIIEDASTSIFHGLTFYASESYDGYELGTTTNGKHYGVCIAKKNSSGIWEAYAANDGAGLKLGDATFVNALTNLKYNIEDIKVNDFDTEQTPITGDLSQEARDRAQDTNTYSKNRQNLKTYLDYNYILDDGEL